MEIPRPVNLSVSDGDPRKVAAVSKLVRKFPDAIDYWRHSGICERVTGKDGTTRHKHGVLSHMLGGAMISEAIGGALVERSVLNVPQAERATEAVLVHDADKTTDMKFILHAMDPEKVSWRGVKQILDQVRMAGTDRLEQELAPKFSRYFDPDVGVGTRVHVARAFVAGAVHRERLTQAGFPPETVLIQSATEYTGCDTVDKLLDLYPNMDPADRVMTVQQAVVNHVDNCMMESRFVSVDERTRALFAKPINVALSQAYTKWNDLGETAEAKQMRVGNRVEGFLAQLCGVAPAGFLGMVEQRVVSNIMGGL